MKNRSAVLMMLLIGARVLAAASNCAPAHTVRMVVRAESPGIPAGHFAGLPKTIIRLGAGFARVEEANDEANDIHGLMIIGKDQSWLANLNAKTGTHIVDPEPPTIVHFPVFPEQAQDPSFPAELRRLEFGCEAAFFDQQKSPAEPFRGDKSGRTRRAFGTEEWLAVLVNERNASEPSVLLLLHRNEVVASIRYLSYAIVSDDPKLFEPPSGITFTEAAPD
jgi:hypothetical protein